MDIEQSSRKRKLSDLELSDDDPDTSLPAKRPDQELFPEIPVNTVDTFRSDLSGAGDATDFCELFEDNHDNGSDQPTNNTTPAIDDAFTPASIDDSEDTAYSSPVALQHPTVWAKTRSALCDALPYFRCHEGGNYHIDRVTLGLLLDSNGSPRDYMDGTVIITAVGGGRVAIDKTGKRASVEDQDESARNYQYLKATMPNQNASDESPGRTVVVIAGKNNDHANVSEEYCVLGEYQVTDLWLEKFPDSVQTSVAVASWMVRLEKVEFNKSSWFKPKSTSHDVVAGQYKCPSLECISCGKESKQIYDKGWACLHNTCARAFIFQVVSNGQVEERRLGFNEIQYSAEFLYERTLLPAEATRQDLIPPLPTIDNSISFGTEAEFKRGMVCPLCKCASRRISWHGWKCENTESCNFTHMVQTRPYPLQEIARETRKVKSRYKQGSFTDSLVKCYDRLLEGYATQVYTFPDEAGQTCGTAIVLRATEEICAKEDGPDALYMAMQDRNVDLKLERSAARHTGKRHEELCSHFTSNFGAPYKFGVAVKTVAFRDAPEPILRGVSQLSWAQRVSIEDTKSMIEEEGITYSSTSMTLKSEPFNELLALGYFESSVINYHDDGEKDLGPTVATLSLGSPSIMRFRPKKKSKVGPEVKNLRSLKPAVVSIPLYHGDIVIMHGTELQKNYEHEVKPKGKLRFAMTSRYIMSNSWSEERRQDTMEKSKLPLDFEKLAYGGVTIDIQS
ncbi:hypothetical protein PFICI_03034 [Pestalotiopsis fici W106-1]|uniref:Fe2OG dioxygenase domain-containing protein n=1 Tax=Pestalotiopsis fici (strain W106-1 / CGMCC3.15140) TaxID=1229662 RepID=W3XG74_PESFW|nr:uncharacterized protein PFICI_03034 [Pestalotiopsis fici W106-1]ETS85009.1 hypothetical protein PFICI_03034 [Pestalotiopsis fici W106-1]